VVLFAINTKVLPAARDVCAEYLWHNGYYVARVWQLMLHKVIRWAEQMLVVSVTNELEEVEFLQANCTLGNPTFHRMSQHDINELEEQYRWLTLPFSILLGAMFLGPHLLYAFHDKLLPRKRMEDAETVDEEQDVEIESLSVQAANQKRELREMKKRMAEFENKLKSLM